MTDRLRSVGLALLLASPALAATPEAPVTVYVGTYTDGTSRGIYRTSLDTASGRASAPVLAAEAKNPSFLALHPSGRFLYAVSEVDELAGAKTGAVSAFAIDPKTGDLTLLNQQPSEGGAPCHLIVDHGGRNLLVANYGGGTVALLRIGADGKLQPAASVRHHEGQGPTAARQQKPHAHGIYLDAAERFAFAPDLGADRVFVYRFDAEKGTLTPQGAAPVEPGSGPRHLAFHPKGRHAYVISELSNTITVFGYDPAKGELSLLETVKTLPEGFAGTSYTAEIEVSPDGRFLYGSNRGHDSLVVFRIDAASGRLALVGHVPVGGAWPRHFAIAAGGRLLLAAHQRSGTIAVFKLDETSGIPAPLGASVAVDRPACLLPLPPAR
ncbi:MAG TPA: lactonase family protein [Vicinamibacteria bacterium]|nr:lactonase family protein [Vicinamibacteria bacterium]